MNQVSFMEFVLSSLLTTMPDTLPLLLRNCELPLLLLSILSQFARPHFGSLR